MKHRKLVTLVVAVAVIVSLVFIGCAPEAAPPAPPEEEEAAPETEELESFHITHSSGIPEGHPWITYTEEPFDRYVEKITQGRVKVDLYTGGAIHSWGDALMAVETGLTDFTQVWCPALPGRFPLMDLFTLPGLMPNQITSDCVVRELVDKYPCFEEQFGDKVVNLFCMVSMRADLHTVKPIRDLDELQGKVIVCQNATGAKALSTLGASTSVMVGSDAYLAAERGVVDGIFCAWGWVSAYRFDEVCPYHTLLSICPGSSFWPMNKSTFERFTALEQIMLKQYRYEGMFNGTRGNVYLSMKVREPIPQDHFIEWSLEDMNKVEELFRPSWEEWADEIEALGYPGRAILDDAVRFRNGYVYG